MKAKKLRKKIWCSFNGIVPLEFKHMNLYRCPVCKKRYQVNVPLWNGSLKPKNEIYRISPHKREV